MRRFLLVLCTLALVAVCCGPSESTDSESDIDATTNANDSTSIDVEACIAECQKSDHPGCTQVCSPSATPTPSCSAAPELGAASRRRAVPPPPQGGAGGTDAGGTGGDSGSGGTPAPGAKGDEGDCTCVGEYPPQCVSVCAPPETEQKPALQCSFAPPR